MQIVLYVGNEVSENVTCRNCKYNDGCKHKEEYKKAIERAKNIEDEIACVLVKVECRWFREQRLNVNEY